MSQVKINSEAIQAFFKDKNGPLAKHELMIAEKIKQKTVESLREGFPRNFLGPSIVKRIITESNGPHVLVGSSRTRTRPHPIEGNPVLVFNWPKAGGTVYFRHVNHPGSDFNQYITNKLTEALQAVKGTV